MDLLRGCVATVESVDFKNVSVCFGYERSNVLSTFKTVNVRLLQCFRRKVRAEFLPHNSLHPAVGAPVTHIQTFLSPDSHFNWALFSAALLLLGDDVWRVFIHILKRDLKTKQKTLGPAAVLNGRRWRR